MSDKDLIRRGEVLKEIERFAGYLDDDMILRLKIAIRRIKPVPSVPQEMSAVEYDRERRRMCKQYGYCSVSCPLHDFDAGCMTYEPITQEAQNIVEKWVKEHPEERSEE